MVIIHITSQSSQVALYPETSLQTSSFVATLLLPLASMSKPLIPLCYYE